MPQAFRISPLWGKRFRLDSAGINRREVANERVLQERIVR